MSRLLLLLTAFVLLAPLGCVLIDIRDVGANWNSRAELARLGELLSQTTGLAFGTLLIALPIGTFLGVVLERFQFPSRSFCRALLLAALFVPLPVYAIAWQIVLGNWLPAFSLQPGQVEWRPWKQGLLPSIWIHGCAAVPWVAWIVRASLRRTSQTLEEDASLIGGWNARFRLVLGPRIGLAILAASGFVTTQVATEICVTDAMMVRTFAEEIYTQLVGNPIGVASAVAVTLPVWLLTASVAVGLGQSWARRFLPDESASDTPPSTSLPGNVKLVIVGGLWLAIGVLALLPLMALLGKAGLSSDGWSATRLLEHVGRSLRLSGVTLAWGAVSAMVCGIVTVSLATFACWHTRRRGSGFVIALAVILAFTPGPILGFGLKLLFNHLMNLEEVILRSLSLNLEFPPCRSLLYDQPSPVPGIWACAIRFFPVAVALVYPQVRLLPREQLELAKLDGLSPWRWVGWPMLKPAMLQAAIAVGVLSLGEVSASKLVVPPHWNVFILDLFNQMHYGTESTVAAMALTQVAITSLGVWLLHEIVRGDMSLAPPSAAT